MAKILTSTSSETATKGGFPTDKGKNATKRYLDIHVRADVTGGKQTSRGKIVSSVASAVDALLEALKEADFPQATIDPEGSSFAFSYGPWYQGTISE
jgi:hypothetical protein